MTSGMGAAARNCASLSNNSATRRNTRSCWLLRSLGNWVSSSELLVIACPLSSLNALPQSHIRHIGAVRPGASLPGSAVCFHECRDAVEQLERFPFGLGGKQDERSF